MSFLVILQNLVFFSHAIDMPGPYLFVPNFSNWKLHKVQIGMKRENQCKEGVGVSIANSEDLCGLNHVLEVMFNFALYHL